MRRNLFVTVVVLLLFTTLGRGETIFEFPLDGPVDYQREIGPMQALAQSRVHVYVENVFDPLRWKDWRIEIWVPIGSDDVNIMEVDYDNTPNHSNPIELFPVNLAPVVGPAPWVGFKGFYASTWEPAWQDAGTTPEGSVGPHPWGNPAWVSFHFDVPEGPFGLYIYDECIPEPSMLVLLLLGTLALLKRSRSV